MNTTTLRAVIYTRVSRDNAGGRSVAEQERECRAVCEREGWPVAEVIEDNDRSASRYATKDRPGFDRLRSIVAPGHVIVCWEASRLSRDLAAMIGLRDLCIERGVALSYGGQIVELTEAKFVIDGMLAEQESMKTRDRILRAHRANLADGKPHGRVPYGYRIQMETDNKGRVIKKWREPDPARAALIVEAAHRILDGHSLRSVVQWIESHDPLGWDSAKLRRVLLNPTTAGFRTRTDVVNGQRTARVIHGEGTWEAILSENQHNQLVALFAGRASGPRGTGPAHLLTGIATCAECKEPMWRRKGGRKKDGGAWIVLACPTTHCARRMDLVEESVHAVVEGILTTPEALAALAEVPDVDTTAPARLAELREQLATVEIEMLEQRMPIATGARVATRLEAMIAEAEAATAPVFTEPVVRQLATAPDPVAMWRSLPLLAQRDFIKAVLVVEVQRIGKGRWHDKRAGISITPRRPRVEQS